MKVKSRSKRRKIFASKQKKKKEDNIDILRGPYIYSIMNSVDTEKIIKKRLLFTVFDKIPVH
jgi:hypothetical protein